MPFKAINYITIFAGLLFIASCSNTDESGSQESTDSLSTKKAVINSVKFQDPHSFAKPNISRITHLDLRIKVNFAKKQIEGVANYDIEQLQNENEIILDTRGLAIQNVTDPEAGDTLDWELGEEVPLLGQALIIELKPETKKISIAYNTTEEADALQWLEPRQTAGGKDPYLFTQSQAILARTWIPVQDGPGIRVSYEAVVGVPENLMALMSAANPTEKNGAGVYSFEMKQPIPAYLMALAVGNIEFRKLGERTGVYAEPGMINKAANEFSDLPKMLAAAEKLYGNYQWDQYDLLVLPPSFPFGGMENPRLTFVTPTILAGDKSLTSLIAHELAHSWSGNLVTNVNWNDFWLNEGFTVYIENRIMEEIYGESYAKMLAQLGYQDLQHSLKTLDKEDTKLKLDLEGRDPDEGLTDIAYEKGALFLRQMELRGGRARMDSFLISYFEENAFKSMSSELFMDYYNVYFLKDSAELDREIKAEDWIYGAGLPDNHIKPESDRFAQVDSSLKEWKNGKPAAKLKTDDYTTHEWLHFIRHLPDTVDEQQLESLDEAFSFTSSNNSEIQAAWYLVAINNRYKSAYPAISEFLIKVGRRKFLSPLYAAFAKSEKGKERANQIYIEARPNYHSVSYGTIDEILNYSAD